MATAKPEADTESCRTIWYSREPIDLDIRLWLHWTRVGMLWRKGPKCKKDSG